jgi:hypothetical protein
VTIAVVSTNRGSGTEKTSDTSLTVTPLATMTAGNYGLLGVVIDNIATTSGQTTDISVADTQGHIWTRLREHTQTAGVALDGVAAGLFLARLTNGLTTSDTVTVTLSANATAKGARLAELSVDGGNILQLEAGESNAAAASTSYSVTLSGLASQPYIFVGLAAAEDELLGTVTLDTGYTAFGGTVFGSGTGGANITNVVALDGYLLATATGDTFDNTGLTSADRVTLLVALEEATGTQSVTAVTFTVTTSQPQASAQVASLTATTTSATPTQPATTLRTDLAAVTLTATPSQPVATVSAGTQISAVTLDIQSFGGYGEGLSDYQPPAALSSVLSAATLYGGEGWGGGWGIPWGGGIATPQASIASSLSATTLVLAPSHPAGTVALAGAISTPTVLAAEVNPTLSGGNTILTTDSVSPGADRLLVLFVACRTGTGIGWWPTVSGLGLTWERDTRGHEGADTYIRQAWMWHAVTDGSPSSGPLTVTFGGATDGNSWYSIVQFEADEVDLDDPILQPRARFPDLPPANGGQTFTATHEMASFADAADGLLHFILIGAVATSGETIDAAGFTRLVYSQNASSWATLTEWKASEDLLIDPDWTASGEIAHWVSIAAEIRATGTTDGTVRDRLLVTGSSTTNGTVYTAASNTTYANRDIWLAVTSARSGATPSEPTITDTASLTWDLVDSQGYATNASPTQKLWVFHARTPGSDPGAFTITITYPETQTSASWIASETRFTDDTTPWIQTAKINVDSGGASGLTATFGAGLEDSSAVLFFLAKNDADRSAGADVLTGTVESGYVQHDQSAANETPATSISAFARHTSEATPSIDLRQNADAAIIALEVAAGGIEGTALTATTLSITPTLPAALLSVAGEALTVTRRVHGVSTSALTTYTTDSGGDGDGTFTPAPNVLLLAVVNATGTAALTDPTSVTGNGATWTEVAQIALPAGGSPIRLYAALSGSSPTDTAFSVTFGSAPNGCNLSVYEITGADVSGTAAAALVQTVTNSGSGTSGSVTLAAGSHASNRPFAAFSWAANEAGTEDADFDELHDTGHASPARRTEVQWRSDAFDTATNATWTSSVTWAAIATELKASVPAQTVTAVTLTVAPTLSAAAIVAAQSLTAATLVVTTTRPAASVRDMLVSGVSETGRFLTTETTDVGRRISYTLTTGVTDIGQFVFGLTGGVTFVTASTLTITPAFPIATLQVAQSLTALSLTVTPTQPQATLRTSVTAAALTVVPSQPAASLERSLIAAALAVTPTQPVATIRTEIAAATLSITPAVPAADVRAERTAIAVTLTTSPTLPVAVVEVDLIAAQTFTLTPTLPAAELQEPQADQVLAATVLVIPSLGVAALEVDLLGATLTVSPTQPAASLAPSLTASPLTVTPTAIAAARFDITLTAATLTETPTFPVAEIPSGFVAQTLTIVPVLPVADVVPGVTAATLEITPVLPAAFIGEPVGAVALVVTPTLPVGVLHHRLPAVMLQVTPVLPVATATVHAVGVPARGPTRAVGTGANRVLAGAGTGPNHAEVT